MSVLKEVTISGAIGKQVFATSDDPVILKGVIATASAVSAVAVTILDGNASGETRLVVRSDTGISRPFRFGGKGVRFDKGMHVKVIGTNGTAYLVIN